MDEMAARWVGSWTAAATRTRSPGCFGPAPQGRNRGRGGRRRGGHAAADDAHPLVAPDLIDTCGTGGDGSRTFNISTAAALVTAAAGVPVAKHGNRGITSRSGSADVLAALGVNVEADVALGRGMPRRVGHLLLLRPAVAHGDAARLGRPQAARHADDLQHPRSAGQSGLGPVSVARRGPGRIAAAVGRGVALLGTRRALVVHGSDGLDEVTLDGVTEVIEVSGGTPPASSSGSRPISACQPAGRETMLVGDPDESAGVIRQILDGRAGPPRDIVVANAAAALWTAGRSSSLEVCAEQTRQAIDSGAARDLLAKLAQRTSAPPGASTSSRRPRSPAVPGPSRTVRAVRSHSSRRLRRSSGVAALSTGHCSKNVE